MQTQSLTQKSIGGLDFSESIDEIKNLILGSWRFRWQALSLTWFLCIASWAFVFSMPDIYRASTRLYIDTRGSLEPLLEGLAVNADLLDEIRVMVKSITSRPNLQRIAAVAGLDLETGDPADMERRLERLREMITIELGKDQILEISYEQANPRVAKSVISALVDLFVESLLQTNRNDTGSAQEFIESKAKEYEVLLSEAETRLAEFKKRNVGQMPGQQGGYYQRLQSEIDKQSKLESQLRLATQKRDILESQMAGETPVFGLMGSGQQNAPIDSEQIRELEMELTGLRLQFTDAHPDIVRIQTLLKSLRAELAQQQPSTTGPKTVPLDLNPVYQKMKIQFSQAELDVASLRTALIDQRQLVNQLKKRIDTLPEIEAELTRLNRNYDVNKAQYDALLRRLETARLTEDAEESRNSVQFRVIDPPIVASTPVAPNRILLMTITLLLGISAGMALALFRSFADPVFYSSRKLERQYGVPVLGAIMLRRSRAEIWQAWVSLSVFSICILGLIVCYFGVIFFEQSGLMVAGQSVPVSG